MKVLMISGSRNPQGKTATMAEAALRGAAQAGAQCERVWLPEMKMERCRQCDEAGWGDCRAKGSCVIEDDFAALVTKIRQADAVVFATPVYFGDLSESLRAFTDRLRRITRHEAGKAGIVGKPALGVSVAGGSGNGSFFCADSLNKTLSTSGFEVRDSVAVRRQMMDLKAPSLEAGGRALGR
ncbi:MAG: flavodoxin family protein [Candidatus Sumerlaeota bacterium]|nr:flavodoxin family protein [Candidatus Sumerlaeota bacterium]